MNDTTLRDLFASHALTGLLAFSPPEIAGQMDPRPAARDAYLYADAMMEARKAAAKADREQAESGSAN